MAALVMVRTGILHLAPPGFIAQHKANVLTLMQEHQRHHHLYATTITRLVTIRVLLQVIIVLIRMENTCQDGYIARGIMRVCMTELTLDRRLENG